MVAELIVQLIKCLPCKHEDISLIPRDHVKKLGMVAFACNPRIGKLEMDKLLGLLNLSRISGMPSFVLF